MAMNSSRGRTSDARTNQLDHMLYVLKLGWRVRVKYVSLPVKLHVVLSIAWIWIKPISLAGRQSMWKVEPGTPGSTRRRAGYASQFTHTLDRASRRSSGSGRVGTRPLPRRGLVRATHEKAQA